MEAALSISSCAGIGQSSYINTLNYTYYIAISNVTNRITWDTGSIRKHFTEPARR